MPGTPATSPRFGAPRFSNADAVDFAGQVNGVTDAFDANARRLSDPITETNMAVGATGLVKGSFSAYRTATLSLATGAVVIFDTDSGTGGWDFSNWYSTATGRFTPQIAGIYRFNWLVTSGLVLTADVYVRTQLRRNGTTAEKNAPSAYQRGAVEAPSSGMSALVDANGSTDFFDVIYLHNQGTSQAVGLGRQQTYFQAELVGRT